MYSAHVSFTIPVFTFFSTGLHVPPTLGEAMKVENAEANYEQTFENVYGMSVQLSERYIKTSSVERLVREARLTEGGRYSSDQLDQFLDRKMFKPQENQ